MCFWFTNLYSSLELCSEFQIPVGHYQPGMSIWVSHKWLIPDISKAEPHIPFPHLQNTCPISSLLYFNKWHEHPSSCSEIWASSLTFLSPLTLTYNPTPLLSPLLPNYISHLPPSLRVHWHQNTIISSFIIIISYHPAAQSMARNQMYMCHWELARSSESSLQPFWKRI